MVTVPVQPGGTESRCRKRLSTFLIATQNSRSIVGTAHGGAVEIGPHIRTALAAGRADEAALDVGEPEIVGPAIAADRDQVAAL